MKKDIVYKREIGGFSDVLETVKSEEQIAAALIHGLRDKLNNLRVLEKKLADILERLKKFYFDESNVLLKKRQTGKRVAVFVGMDKGLVGELWSSLFDLMFERKKDYDGVIVVGNVGKKYFSGNGKWNAIDFLESAGDDLDAGKIISINNYIFNGFKEGSFREVDIVYPEFVSLTEQNPAIIRFLPFDFGSGNPAEKLSGAEEAEAEGFPIFEPSSKAAFNYFLEKYIEIFFYKIIVETKLSELAARTVTMESAINQATKVIKKLELAYFKERRKILTQKQIESFSAHKIKFKT